MKIGILSMQRIVNYGSFLQAYGLKKTLESLGHDVVFVDYHIGEPIVSTVKTIPENRWSYLAKNILKPNFWKMKRLYKNNNFIDRYKNEFLPILDVYEERIYNEKVDTLVIGSDEVFNCLQSNKDVGYSLELFGKNANADKIISYAASFGTTTLNELKYYGKQEEISNLLNGFSSISVRDNNSFKIIKKLLNKAPSMNLDPVLISNFDDEVMNIHITEKKYILIYAYANRLTKKEIKLIKKFARIKKMTLLCLGFPQEICDKNIVCTPFETLAYVKNAEYIITDTFHGTIFSLKYNKPFVTIIRDSNRQKLSDLLMKFNCLDREFKDGKDLFELFDYTIDFDYVNNMISKEREKSLNYLKENL